ncbi:MAG: cation:proton antiporter [Oligoflexales bacterium]|nr:cation:proton antiporter [Oligoflexales bacterium]
MPDIIQIAILCISSLIFGLAAERLGQPKMAGQMLAGLIIGPQCLSFVKLGYSLGSLSNICAVIIICVATLEIEIDEIRDSLLGKGFIMGLMGFFVPFSLGIALGRSFNLTWPQSSILACCISVTALPVTIRILESFNMIHTKLCSIVVSAAVLNDLLALMVLGILIEPDDFSNISVITRSIALDIGRFLIFISILGVIHSLIIKKWLAVQIRIWGRNRLFTGMTMSSSLLLILGSLELAKFLQVHGIIAAFFGTLLASDVLSHIPGSGERIRKSTERIMEWVFVPIFFAAIGYKCDLHAFKDPLLVLSITIVAVMAKLVAGFLGAKITGLSRENSIAAAILLNGRGIMEMVVADIAFQKGIINSTLFSSLLFMGLVTTALTPVLFQRCYLRNNHE